MRQFTIRILIIMKAMFKIKLYHQLLNLSVMIFILNMNWKCHRKTGIEKEFKSNDFFIRKNKNNRKKYC